jgi:hypothetical protein
MDRRRAIPEHHGPTRPFARDPERRPEHPIHPFQSTELLSEGDDVDSSDVVSWRLMAPSSLSVHGEP